MDLTTGTAPTPTAPTAVQRSTRTAAVRQVAIPVTTPARTPAPPPTPHVTVGQVAAPVVTSARTQARSPSTHRRASTPAERPTLQQTVLSPTAGGGTDTAVLGTPSVLYRKVVQARRVLGELAELATDERVTGGEITALIGLLGAIEQGQIAAVALTDRIQRAGLAERTSGLPLEHLLALQTRQPHACRRALTTVAEALRCMPHLATAFRDGAVSYGQVRAVVAEAAPLTAQQRTELDERFADPDRIRRHDPDRLLDLVRDEVARLLPQRTERDAIRVIESRFLHVQPAFDGALTLYGELDPEAGVTFLDALQAASPPPTAGRHDVTRHALDPQGDTESDGSNLPDTANGQPDDHTAPTGTSDTGDQTDGTGHNPNDPDELRAFCDPLPHRSRARQRADGLLHLAETYLAGTGHHSINGPERSNSNCGSRGDAAVRRPRPRMLVVTDLATLTGDDQLGRTSRALWATLGASVALTPQTIRRLASDAVLQHVLTDRSQILGVTAPTPVIPARVRVAVTTRDHGCRFPGCRLPIAWCDLHHVIAREHGGPTTIDNLVALCRRHHTAITQGHWHLTMTSDGTVTIRRGRHTATSDPPLTAHLPTGSDGTDPPTTGDPPNRPPPDGSSPPVPIPRTQHPAGAST